MSGGINIEASSAVRVQRDPKLAAALSVMPGLGQLYNGEARKGLLFIDVAAVNIMLLWAMFCSRTMVDVITRFAGQYHFKPNWELLRAVEQMHIGTPCSIVVSLLILAYVAYAMRDAYDVAATRRLRSIYADSIFYLPEATSGSYLLHLAALLACSIIAFLFLLPPAPRTQVTEIEFLNTPSLERHITSPIKTTSNTEAQGKHLEHMPLSSGSSGGRTAPSPITRSSAPANLAPRAVAQSTTKVPVPPNPVPIFKPALPTAMPSTTPAVKPVPSPVHVIGNQAPMPRSQIVPTQPMPLPLGSASPVVSAVPTPQPAFTRTVASLPAPVMPQLHSGSAGSGNPALPQPVQPATNQQSASMPTPAARSGQPATTAGDSSAPTPHRLPSGGAGGKPLLAVSPVPGSGIHDAGPPNSQTNNNPGETRKRTEKVDINPNFGPYMEQLQRRIRERWNPPKDTQSLKVVVLFRISPKGELSDLRIEKSAGVSIADQAALRAVENAAPFNHLPAGADEAVDVQFTFDYNVYNGSGGRGAKVEF